MGRAAGKREGDQPGGFLCLNVILKFSNMCVSMSNYLIHHDSGHELTVN